MIDLHSHSTASDGSLTPKALLNHASQVGLKAIALTDHDTVDGLEEARLAAGVLGIRFVPGIEIEISWDSAGVFHLLGLNIYNYRQGMRDILPRIGALRTRRNEGIVKRMKEYGLQVDLPEIAALAGGAIITRPHFADYLVGRGMVKNRKQAFEKYLTPGKAFYEKYPGIELEEAIEAIHASGGIAVIAHPLSLYVSWNKLADCIAEWKKVGLDGIEAYHPTAKYREAGRLQSIAEQYGLKVSAGSDFHGEHRPDRILGKTLAERKPIDDSFLDILGDK